jgi:hypothetical protein
MKKILSILLITLASCTKPAMSHSFRVITFALDENNQYVHPSNTVMYLNNKCVCFTDSLYGYNTNPTFAMDGISDADELHIISFVNAGEPIQYKTIRVYVDNKLVYNVSNSTNINTKVNLR